MKYRYTSSKNTQVNLPLFLFSITRLFMASRATTRAVGRSCSPISYRSRQMMRLDISTSEWWANTLRLPSVISSAARASSLASGSGCFSTSLRQSVSRGAGALPLR